MNQNKTIDAVDPIGLSLPEEREVWYPTGTSGYYKESAPECVPRSWVLCFKHESDCELFTDRYFVGPKGIRTSTTISKVMDRAHDLKAPGVVYLTYADGRWLVLAEYRITERNPS